MCALAGARDCTGGAYAPRAPPPSTLATAMLLFDTFDNTGAYNTFDNTTAMLLFDTFDNTIANNPHFDDTTANNSHFDDTTATHFR